MQRPSTLRLALLLGSLSAFAPLAIDMYLPAFPQISRELHVTIGEVQLSLASFLIGMALGQLIYGPISDRIGRKTPLIIGCLAYSGAAFGCIFTSSSTELIFWRFLMGLGGSAGMVLTRAVVRDLFDEVGSVRMYSMMMLVVAIAPLFAPFLGGQILTHFNWHAIFYVLIVFGLACAVSTTLALPETLDPEKRTGGTLGAVLRGYLNLSKERPFVGYAVAAGLASGSLFAYVSGSSFVFIDLYGISPQHFGYYFGLNAAGLFGAAQLNGWLLKSFNSQQIIKAAFFGNALLGLLLLAAGWSGWGGFPLLCSLLFLMLAGMGLTLPNLSALAMEPYGRNAGSASALLGTIQFSLGSAAGILVGLFHNGTAFPMTAVIALGSFAGLLILLFFTETPAAGNLQDSATDPSG